jgi:hypothetical protein
MVGSERTHNQVEHLAFDDSLLTDLDVAFMGNQNIPY